jgi:hypothetical protein
MRLAPIHLIAETIESGGSVEAAPLGAMTRPAARDRLIENSRHDA